MLFITIDGMGDKIRKNQKTSLEKARTPNLDFLAKNGRCGLVSTVGEKIAPESDIALTAILGYDPFKYYTGRGPLEAFGMGIRVSLEAHGLGVDLNEKDLVLRANFATINDKGKIIDRRAGRTLTTKEAVKLARRINSKVKLDHPFLFQSEGEHRAILVIEGDFSPNISNTDPGYAKEGMFGVVSNKKIDKFLESKALDKSHQSKKAALAVNQFVEKTIEVLKESKVNKERVKKGFLPANIVLTRDAGTKLPNFPLKKEKWAAVVGYPLEVGLAKKSGMKAFKVSYPELKERNIYKYLYRCLNAEIEKALNVLKKELDNFSSFWIHFKPVDIPGHDGREKDKIKMIEILDKKFFKILVEHLGKNRNLKIIVTADHATPCSLKLHSADLVPILVYDGVHKDKVAKFGEQYCRKGTIGHIMGKDIIKKLTVKN